MVRIPNLERQALLVGMGISRMWDWIRRKYSAARGSQKFGEAKGVYPPVF